MEKQRFLTDLSLNGTTELTGPAILSGSTTISGATTLSGATTVSGAATFTAANTIINGNVGIGKTNPGYPLDVSGSIIIRNGGYYTTIGCDSRFTSADTFATFLNNDKVTSGDLRINTTSRNSNVLIENGGLAIGKTTITSGISLDVSGNISSSHRTGNGGNGVNTVISSNNGAFGTIECFNNDNIGPSSKLPISIQAYGGNVGIGTTNPAAKLDVVGSINVSGSITGSGTTYFTSTGDSRYTSANASVMYINNDKTTSGNVIINTNSPNSNVIVEKGNVGIGTTSAGSKLHVEGGSVASGTNLVIIKMGAGSSNHATDSYFDPFSIGSTTGALTMGMGVDTTRNSGYINCAMSGAVRPIEISRRSNAGVNLFGKVGIGRDTPEYNLHISGNAYVIAGGGIEGNNLIMGFAGSEFCAGFYDAGYIQNSSSAKSCLRLGHAYPTSRSINASGTINATGGDYAEYMRKKDNTFTINKGDICGIDASGNLTNLYDEAYSFVVKSTLPSYVGGDNWHDPSDNMPDISNNEAYTAWEIRFEARRLLVDRIAFCGQVPVNIDTTNVKVGDHIIPNRTSDGKIEALAVSDPTFVQYKSAVGKVINILSSSKANIIVKIC